jgi:hypothetical protein
MHPVERGGVHGGVGCTASAVREALWRRRRGKEAAQQAVGGGGGGEGEGGRLFTVDAKSM